MRTRVARPRGVMSLMNFVSWRIALRMHRGVRPACILICVFLTCSCLLVVSQVTVNGSVRDASGAAIQSAQVSLRSAHSSLSTKTDERGSFTFASVGDSFGSIRVAAPGFASVEQKWTTTKGNAELTISLQPESVSEQVVVSATRSELKISDLPGAALQISSEDIAVNPAVTTDDLLRQVPGFNLFRRSSSRVANPTSQGVSLRGVGASGPSRALVLFDGVPFVDPFGGWVYWDRMPRAELSSVEVVRGGESELYGSDAMGGVIQFMTRTAEQPSLSADISYGNENTPDLSLWAGTTLSRWDMGAAIDMSRSDGYILVPASQRGTVDTDANSKHATVDASLGYKISDASRAFLRGSFFDQSRNNGTPIQVNSTGTGFGVAGVNAGLGAHDFLSTRIFGQAQGYDQSFSSVAADRNSEKLTNLQHVPSQQLGGSAQWNHLLKDHTLIFGTDVQEIMGDSVERLFSTTSGSQFAINIAGGRQRYYGIFGQDIFRIAQKWTIIAGLRWDGWSNFDASTVRIPVPAATNTGTVFADRSATAYSPRLSILRSFGSNTSVWISGSRAFRAPTLNELYRSFRQGSVTTASDALLNAERSSGAEAGLKQNALGNRLEARADIFWADIVDPVVNVTLTPTTRQRQNLGRTRSVGMELDGVLRLNSFVQFTGGYQYTHATVTDSTAVPVGLSIPEVPRHSFTFEARYWNPAKVMLSLEGRYSSLQYDDDQNTLLLPHYFVADLFLGRALGRGLTIYGAAENLFNQRYAVSVLPPVENLGPPILARIGIRVDLPRAR